MRDQDDYAGKETGSKLWSLSTKNDSENGPKRDDPGLPWVKVSKTV